MKPREVQELLDLTQTTLGLWLRYRQYFQKGMSKDPIGPEEEAEFLSTTSTIAQNIRKIGQRVAAKEFPFRKEEISGQLKSSISIGQFRSMPSADQKVFYREWHVSRVYLSRTVGALKFIQEGYVPAVKTTGKSGAKGGPSKGKKKGGGGFSVKPVAIGAVVIAIIVIALMMI